MRKREIIRCLISCSKYLMIKGKAPLIQRGMSSLCGDRWFTIITSLYGITKYHFQLFRQIYYSGFKMKILLWCEVKVAQSCSTLCHSMDYVVHGILQARILEWVAYPFSSGSSPPRNWIRVSCIAGRFFTSWATREVPTPSKGLIKWQL